MSFFPGSYTDFVIDQPIRRKIFVSYHHGNDQRYYDLLAMLFAEHHEMIHDNSLDRRIDSADADYVIRQIRETYLTGTSCTIVLCGAETPQRKWVDWEILATLNKQHALMGVRLPSARLNDQGRSIVPDRFLDNYASGYAYWTDWNTLMVNPGSLPSIIEDARSRPKSLINNSRPPKSRNG